MTYTSHGHHIDGSPVDPSPPTDVIRCGGPGLCSVCTRESATWTEENRLAALLQKQATAGLEGHSEATTAARYTPKKQDYIAIQFTGGPGNGHDIVNWVKAQGGNATYVPYEPPYRPQGPDETGHDGWPEVIQIEGIETWKEASVGWWIVQDPESVFETYRPERFNSKFEPKE